MIAKIAFLFLTIDSVFHEAIWVRFFTQSEVQERYSLYVHPKKSMAPTSFFASAVIPERLPTSWANTMEAQVALLREALKDPANTKFVFLSESTIPLATFDEIYTRLLEHPKSQFNFKKNPFAIRTFGSIKPSRIYFNSQWIILNRTDAQLMVDDTEILPIMARHPHDQEHYPSTLLAHHKCLDQVVSTDLTFVHWIGTGGHPHLFKELTKDPSTDRLLSCIENKRFLFARKFSKGCDLTPLHRLIPELY